MGEANPVLSGSPEAWDRLIEDADPAALLVAISQRMSPLLLARLAPEDVLQETLLHAWRDRASFEWHGIGSFRRWLIAIAENRLRNLSDRELTDKRGGGQSAILFSVLGSASGADSPSASRSTFAGPVASTTPSRLACERERAAEMRAALESLPAELREVLRLRLFEERSTEEVAAQLALGPDAVRYRLRQGSALYARLLAARLPEWPARDPRMFASGATACFSADDGPARDGRPRTDGQAME